MSELKLLKDQVAVARSEMKNIRSQLLAMKIEQQKSFERIKLILNQSRCLGCIACNGLSELPDVLAKLANKDKTQPVHLDTTDISYKPIGYIETVFETKRAVPRQPSIASKMKGSIILDANVFNNPEHALAGLEQFSHMWIIYDMHLSHKTGQPMAVVSPPRLHGERTGVFSTRSPHRPCPIGLSLVKICSILGNKIVFEGVDMVNKTPVLDIKPYIPQYDVPVTHLEEMNGDNQRLLSTPQPDTVDSPSVSAELLQSCRITTIGNNSVSTLELHSPRPDMERGAPDGQERYSPPNTNNAKPTTPQAVRIPQWISERRIYNVTFTDEVHAKLLQLIGERADAFKSTLTSLLSEDPRSEYIRTRYPDSEYSCVLEDICITCLFDDSNSTCNVCNVDNTMQNS